MLSSYSSSYYILLFCITILIGNLPEMFTEHLVETRDLTEKKGYKTHRTNKNYIHYGKYSMFKAFI